MGQGKYSRIRIAKKSGEETQRMIKCHYEIHISKNDTYSMDRPHFHEDIEIVLCIAGEGVFFLEPGAVISHRLLNPPSQRGK